VNSTRTQTIEVGEFNVGYIDEGSGEPVIMVHGGESDRTQFTALRGHLGEGIRAISYDQRDSGVTSGPTTSYRMAELADDLADFISALALPDAHIFGTSFGGALAQQFALRHPDKVRTLILVCTTPSVNLTSEALGEALALPAEERRNAMVDFLFTPAGREKDPEMVARNWTTLAVREKDADARRHAAARDHDVTDVLEKIQAPTLVIHGDEDLMAPLEGARMLADRIPDARLELIEGGRHGIATEFPDVVSRLTHDFIAKRSIASDVR